MDTIDLTTMRNLAEHVATHAHGLKYVHTITLTLNGQHGGVDVVITGFENVGFRGNDLDPYDERTIHTVMMP